MADKIWMWIAWRLPKALVSWCYIRVHAKATSGQYSHLHPDEVTWNQALKAFNA